jgi:hypothetical protein
MTQQHPIVPPPELVQQWVDTYFGGRVSQSNFHVDLATQAAQWGSDQELEACCEWIDSFQNKFVYAHDLRLVRRPKPPSLKEQALEALTSAPGTDYPIVMTMLNADQHALIRRALEQLDD